MRFLPDGLGGGISSSSDRSVDDNDEIDGSLTGRFFAFPLPFLFFLVRAFPSESVSLPSSASKFRLYVAEIVVGRVSCVTASLLYHDFRDFKLGFNLNSCFAGRS